MSSGSALHRGIPLFFCVLNGPTENATLRWVQEAVREARGAPTWAKAIAIVLLPTRACSTGLKD